VTPILEDMRSAAYKAKIVLPQNVLDEDALNVFSLTILTPDGRERTRDLPHRELLLAPVTTGLDERERRREESAMSGLMGRVLTPLAFVLPGGFSVRPRLQRRRGVRLGPPARARRLQGGRHWTQCLRGPALVTRSGLYRHLWLWQHLNGHAQRHFPLRQVRDSPRPDVPAAGTERYVQARRAGPRRKIPTLHGVGPGERGTEVAI
jgi:hypothetical protein